MDALVGQGGGRTRGRVLLDGEEFDECFRKVTGRLFQVAFFEISRRLPSRTDGPTLKNRTAFLQYLQLGTVSQHCIYSWAVKGVRLISWKNVMLKHVKIFLSALISNRLAVPFLDKGPTAHVGVEVQRPPCLNQSCRECSRNGL